MCRLTPDEAKDLISQLPSLMKSALSTLPLGADKTVNRQTIASELVERLQVVPSRAEQLMVAVGATIAESVSAGQIREVRNQLPGELRGIFPEV